MSTKNSQRSDESKSKAELLDDLRRTKQEAEGLRIENNDLKSGLTEENDDEDEGNEELPELNPRTRTISDETPIDEYELGVQRSKIMDKIRGKGLTLSDNEITAHISVYNEKTKKNDSLGSEIVASETDLPDENYIGEKFGAGRYSVIIRDEAGIVTKYGFTLSEKRFPKKGEGSNAVAAVVSTDPVLALIQQQNLETQKRLEAAEARNAAMIDKLIDIKNQPAQSSPFSDPTVLITILKAVTDNKGSNEIAFKAMEMGMKMANNMRESSEPTDILDSVKSGIGSVVKSGIEKLPDILQMLAASNMMNGAPQLSAHTPASSGDEIKIEKLKQGETSTVAPDNNQIMLTADQLHIVQENTVTLALLDDIFEDAVSEDDPKELKELSEEHVYKIVHKPIYTHMKGHILALKDKYIEAVQAAIPQAKEFLSDDRMKNYVILIIKGVLDELEPKSKEATIEPPPPSDTETDKNGGTK